MHDMNIVLLTFKAATTLNCRDKCFELNVHVPTYFIHPRH
jgi:hypothetical protein